MFGEQAFESWSLVLVGASVFALLFASLIAAADFVFDGSVQMNWRIGGIAAAAFVGYLGVAALLRGEEQA